MIKQLIAIAIASTLVTLVPQEVKACEGVNVMIDQNGQCVNFGSSFSQTQPRRTQSYSNPRSSSQYRHNSNRTGNPVTPQRSIRTNSPRTNTNAEPPKGLRRL